MDKNKIKFCCAKKATPDARRLIKENLLTKMKVSANDQYKRTN